MHASRLDPSRRMRRAFLERTEDRPPVRAVVLSAWQRARTAGVDPGRREVPLVRGDGRPTDEERVQALFGVGAPVVATAGELLHGTAHGVILADAAGVVLRLAGDRPIAQAAERIGCVPGASWDERQVGNNAIGTSLRLRQPARFAHAEHYCEGWTDWTCAAVPIRWPSDRTVVGCLDVSGYQVAASVRSLVMAARLARVIETLLAEHAARTDPPEPVVPQRSGRAAAEPLLRGLVVARQGGRRLLFEAGDVYLIRARGAEVRLLVDGGEFPAECDGLGELERRLQPFGFARADRAHLVNLKRVRAVEPTPPHMLTLVMGDPAATLVPVSRRRARLFRDLFGI